MSMLNQETSLFNGADLLHKRCQQRGRLAKLARTAFLFALGKVLPRQKKLDDLRLKVPFFTIDKVRPRHLTLRLADRLAYAEIVRGLWQFSAKQHNR